MGDRGSDIWFCLDCVTEMFGKDTIHGMSGGTRGSDRCTTSSREHPLFRKTQGHSMTTRIVAGETEKCADRMLSGDLLKLVKRNATVAIPAIGKPVSDIQCRAQSAGKCLL